MALNPTMLERILDRAKPGDAIASMGYPDILYPQEKLRERLGDKILALKYRGDSEAICKRHGIAKRDIPDAESLFEVFGIALDVYDIVQERGCETLCDLNYPVPQACVGQYDFVIDVGTMEHCFNVAQALMNMAAMVKVGGVVLHENPYNWGNHGFYNFNPTLFHDFYGDNGFSVGCELVDTRTGKLYQAPAHSRFFAEIELNILTVAERVEEREFTIPTQHKYRK
jgi:SAM-dependent methyltransferase